MLGSIKYTSEIKESDSICYKEKKKRKEGTSFSKPLEVLKSVIYFCPYQCELWQSVFTFLKTLNMFHI